MNKMRMNFRFLLGLLPVILLSMLLPSISIAQGGQSTQQPKGDGGRSLFKKFQNIGPQVPFLSDEEITIDYSRGVANLNVKLLTLPSYNNQEIQTLLHYSTAGLKVNDEESEVGLGWSISSVGSITRVMRDLPDEDPQKGYIGAGVGKQLMSEPDILTVAPTGVDCDDLTRSTDLRTGFSTKANCYINIDTKPDYFIFEFFGRSGRIMLDPDGYPVVFPRQNFKIEPAFGPYSEPDTQAGEIERWVITDDMGYQYFFESHEVTTIENATFKKENESSFDVPEYNPDFYWRHVTGEEHLPFENNEDEEPITFISQWNLSRVLNSSGEQIFSVRYFNTEEVVTESYEEYMKAFFAGDVQWKSDGEESLYQITKSTSTLEGDVLREISSSTGKITFEYADIAGNKTLTTMKLFDKDNVLADIITFQYRVVNSLYDQKVFLEGLTKNNLPFKRFDYYNATDAEWDDRNFPNTPYTDAWGYFKAEGSQVYTTKLPKSTGGPSSELIGGNNEIFNPVLGTAIHGTLKSVSGEYGGIVEFNYELNEISPFTIGGLRIDRINYLGEENPISRKLTYEPFDAEGPYLTSKRNESICVPAEYSCVIRSNPSEGGLFCLCFTAENDCSDGPSFWNKEYFVHLQSSFYDLYPKIFYKSVEEHLQGYGNSTDFGYTKYTFSDDRLITSKGMTNAFDMHRGQPEMIQIFNHEGRLQRERRIAYEKISSSVVNKELDVEAVTTLKYKESTSSCSPSIQNFTETLYTYIPVYSDNRDFYYKQSQIIDKVYSDVSSNFASVTRSFSYNVFGQRSSLTETHPSGDVMTKKYYYPSDYSLSMILNNVDYIGFGSDPDTDENRLKYCQYFNEKNLLDNNYNWSRYDFDNSYFNSDSFDNLEKYYKCNCDNYAEISRLQTYFADPQMDEASEAVVGLILKNNIKEPLHIETYREGLLVKSFFNKWGFLEEPDRDLFQGHLFVKESYTHKDASVRDNSAMEVKIEETGTGLILDFDDGYEVDIKTKAGLFTQADGSQIFRVYENTDSEGVTKTIINQYSELYPKVEIIRTKGQIGENRDFYYFNFEEEHEFANEFDFIGGNQINKSFSGSKAYQFVDNQGRLQLKIYKKSIEQPDYRVLFWSSVDQASSIFLSYDSSPIPLRKVRTAQDMHLYEGVFNVGSGPVGQYAILSFSIANGVIDDLMVLPPNAIMKTYTHKPLVGVSSQGDANNDRLLYEYDGQRRLRFVKDINSNVRKAYEYGTVGPSSH